MPPCGRRFCTFVNESIPSEVDRHRAEELFQRGRDYAGRGEHLKAIELYSRAISASPFWLAAYIYWSRGESYAALSRYEEAIADCRVPGEGGEACDGWRLVAVLRESHQPERAIQALHDLHDLLNCCTSRIEDQPADPDHCCRYYYERARARADLKKYEEAIADCHRALEALGAARVYAYKSCRFVHHDFKPDEADIDKLLEAILAETG